MLKYCGIYALQHPETSEVFYVGRSLNVWNRYGQHIQDGASILTHQSREDFQGSKENLIAFLLEEGKLPLLSLLETFESEEAYYQTSDEREKYWIQHYSVLNQKQLTNGPQQKHSNGLRQALLKSGLTQAQLGEAAKVSRATLRICFMGRKISSVNAIRIVNALNKLAGTNYTIDELGILTGR